MRNFILIILGFLGLVGCTTEVDISADYENIPVVYSIIDPTDSVHYVRVNKIFLGNLSAYEMAQIPDSLVYDDTLDVKIHILNENNTQIDVITFEKEMILKDSVNELGEVIFSTEKHHVYSSRQIIPEERDYTYKLVVKLNEHKQVEAEAHPLIGFNQIVPSGNGGRYDLSSVVFGSTFRLPSHANGVQMNAYIHYYEFYRDNTYQRKTIFFPFNKVRRSSSPEITMAIKTYEVRNRFKEEIQPNTNVTYRFLGKADFEYFLADETFTEHLWTRPSSIVSDIAPITNIKGGYGIFACRRRLIYRGHKPTKPQSWTAFNNDADLRLLGFPNAATYNLRGIDTLP